MDRIELNEMPYVSIDKDNHIDISLEKSYWYDKLLNTLKGLSDSDKMKVLNIFYSLKWKDILKNKFKELDSIQQVRLLNLLPYKFKRDMNLMESIGSFKEYYMLNEETMTLNHLYYDILKSPPEEGELILDYGRGIFKKEFPVIYIDPKLLTTVDGNSLLNQFKQAKIWQKKLVKKYQSKKSDIPIVIDDLVVVDGNHRAVAAILNNDPTIKAIQIATSSNINEGIEFIGVCDKVRRSCNGEELWQRIMKDKKSITEKEFLSNINPINILDSDETWIDFKNNHSDDTIEYYKSDDIYFIRVAGFEFIWRKL